MTADGWACVAWTALSRGNGEGALYPSVASHRARFDKAAAWGVPAHVTVLYPFMPPADIDTHVIRRLTAAVSSVPRSHATFEAIDWFGTKPMGHSAHLAARR